MKKNLLAVVAVAFIMLFAYQPALAGGHARIEGAELTKMMNSGTRMIIVDVREPELFARGHIPNAINIPYDTAKKRILKELSPNDTIVFVCHGGPMGDELGEILTSNNYKKVYNVIGGMNRWTGKVSVGKK